MKKILSTAAALGLVVGFAATASALDVPQKVEATTAPLAGIAGEHFGVTGSWAVAGAYVSNAGGNASADLYTDDGSNDAVWLHDFRVLPTLRVNDKTQVKGEVRFSDRSAFGLDDHVLNGGITAPTDGRTIDVRQLYMEYFSPLGKVRIGRTPAGAWGSDFISSSGQGNRIMWWPSFVGKPFSLLLFTQKISEVDVLGGQSDADTDAYYAGVGHSADFGKTDLAYWGVRTPFAGSPDTDAALSSHIWFNGDYKIGNFTLLTELDYGFGDATTLGSDGEAMDLSTLAFMADVGMDLGQANIGVLYFYLSGDDDQTDNDVDNALKGGFANGTGGGTGNDFNPYVLLTGDYAGILNGEKNGVHGTIVDGTGFSAGVQSIGVHGSYAVNNKLSVNAAVGTAWANETKEDWDDSYGWEFDVGASYKLLDNLTYGMHFGWLSTGDYFEGPDNAVTTEDVYMLAHQLTMKF